MEAAAPGSGPSSSSSSPAPDPLAALCGSLAAVDRAVRGALARAVGRVPAPAPVPGPATAAASRQIGRLPAAAPPVAHRVKETTPTRDDVGRATWTLLHTLAAQYPDRPTRGQQKDVRALIDSLTRLYPCGECAEHFAALVRARPPDASSGPALRRWACDVHNAVNRRLGKPSFNCDLVAGRWAPLSCDGGADGSGAACDLRPGR